MRKLLVIAALLSTGTASAETNFRSPKTHPPTTPHMVRNIGFAEQGDAIVVRTRKFERVPATKPYGGNYDYRGGNDCYYNQDDERVCFDDDD